MTFDPRFAAAALRKVSQEPDLHTVIFGAGNATRLALAAAAGADRHAVRAVLDDDPSRCGADIFGVPVRATGDYPVGDVQRVLITSEMFESRLRRRAEQLFDGAVEVIATFDESSSLPSKLGEARRAVADLWDQPHANDALWLEADTLYTDLRERLNALPTWRYGPARQFAEFAQIRAELGDLATWPGLRMLNLGCGRYHPLGLSLLAVMLGAARTCALDLEPVLDPRRSAQALADLVAAALLDPKSALAPAFPSRIEILDRIEPVLDLEQLARGRLDNAVGSPVLEHRLESIYDTPIDSESFDLIVSRDVFEHLSDLPAALRVACRLLRPGGLIYAVIDFSDHRRYENLAAYAHWSHLEAPLGPTHLGTNRIRFGQIPAMVQDAGLAVVRFRPLELQPLPSHVRSRLAPMYQQMSDDDLAVVSAVAVLGKE